MGGAVARPEGSWLAFAVSVKGWTGALSVNK
jgi:hypothetical protein